MIIVVIFALIAHVAYAGNDLSGALGARKFGGRMMSLFSWTIASIAYTAMAPFFFHTRVTALPLIIDAISGTLLAISYPMFLKAVEKGNATITGVIAGTFPLWVVIISVLFLNERLTVPQTMAIITILLGVVLSALHLSRKTRIRNLFNRQSLLAFVVSIMWGISFSMMKYPVDKLGWFEGSYFNGLSGALVTIVWLYPKYKSKLRPVFKKHYIYPLMNASTGVAATIAYSLALERGNNSIVAPIAGSYSGLFAILSYLKFKEKLTKIQLLGVLLILSGVVALSIIVSRS